MKIVTAPEKYIVKENDVCVFLAGGITNCENWQQAVIKELQDKLNTDYLVIFNPRRENFPIDDPSAASKQIEWEFQWLDHTDIFSMYFAGGISDQPICMYELGRNILRMQMRFPTDWQNRIVISCEPNYNRRNDVYIQTQLATNSKVLINSDIASSCVQYHAESIYRAYRNICKEHGILI